VLQSTDITTTMPARASARAAGNYQCFWRHLRIHPSGRPPRSALRKPDADANHSSLPASAVMESGAGRRPHRLPQAAGWDFCRCVCSDPAAWVSRKCEQPRRLLLLPQCWRQNFHARLGHRHRFEHQNQCPRNKVELWMQTSSKSSAPWASHGVATGRAKGVIPCTFSSATDIESFCGHVRTAALGCPEFTSFRQSARQRLV
jgi:hypothetical protein